MSLLSTRPSEDLYPAALSLGLHHASDTVDARLDVAAWISFKWALSSGRDRQVQDIWRTLSSVDDEWSAPLFISPPNGNCHTDADLSSVIEPSSLRYCVAFHLVVVAVAHIIREKRKPPTVYAQLPKRESPVAQNKRVPLFMRNCAWEKRKRERYIYL
jgi:hypothetical protein